MCALGDASGPFTVTMRFTAISTTTPGRSLNSAEVSFDVDGDGPEPRQSVGPVNDDVEVVAVLALAPLGDGPAGATSAWLQLAIAVALLLGARPATREARARS